MFLVWLIGGLALGGLAGYGLSRLQPPKYRRRSRDGFVILGLALGSVVGLLAGNASTGGAAVGGSITVTATPSPATAEALERNRPVRVTANLTVEPSVLHVEQLAELQLTIDNEEAAEIGEVEMCLPPNFFLNFGLRDAAPDAPYGMGRVETCLKFDVTVAGESERTLRVPIRTGKRTGMIISASQTAEVYLTLPEYPFRVNGVVQPAPRTIRRQLPIPLIVQP